MFCFPYRNKAAFESETKAVAGLRPSFSAHYPGFPVEVGGAEREAAYVVLVRAAK
jgi:hypothetical protein